MMETIATIKYPKYCASEWYIKDEISFTVAMLFLEDIERELELGVEEWYRPQFPTESGKYID